MAPDLSDLAAEVAAGRFREDLFYRLSVFPLAWRPLRERPADIVPLAERLLAKYVKKMNHAPIRLSPQAQMSLMNHSWPGNVRELENRIKRAVIMADGSLLTAADLDLAAPAAREGETLDLRGARDRAERDVIHKALLREQGNVARAARLLGVSRPTLYEQMRNLNIRP